MLFPVNSGRCIALVLLLRAIDASPTLLNIGRWDARHYFSLMEAESGNLLVFGGMNEIGDVLDDCWESEDLGTTWRRFDRAPASPRYAALAHRVQSGLIVLTGAGNGASPADDAVVYRSTADAWSMYATPIGERSHYAAARLNSTSLVLSGGWDELAEAQSDVWVITVHEDGPPTWRQVPDPPPFGGLAFHSLAAAQDGTVLLVCGGVDDDFVSQSSCWVSEDYGVHWYPPNAVTSALWDGEGRRESPLACADTACEHVLALGGVDDDDTRFCDVWSIQLVDEVGGIEVMYSRLEDAPWAPRSGHSAVAVSRGGDRTVVVVAGGDDGLTFFDDVWQSWTGGLAWIRVDSVDGTVPRVTHKGVLAWMEPSLLVVGEERVWTSTDLGATWQVTPSIPAWSPREGHAVMACHDAGAVLVVGGRASDGELLQDEWVSLDQGLSWRQSIYQIDHSWQARWEHVALAGLTSSSVFAALVAAGEGVNGTILDDMWIRVSSCASHIEPWKRLAASGQAPPPRGSGVSAVVINNTHVLFCGGRASSTADEASSWMVAIQVANLTSEVQHRQAEWAPRSHAILVNTGSLIILFGGLASSDGLPLPDVWTTAAFDAPWSKVNDPAHTRGRRRIPVWGVTLWPRYETLLHVVPTTNGSSLDPGDSSSLIIRHVLGNGTIEPTTEVASLLAQAIEIRTPDRITPRADPCLFLLDEGRTLILAGGIALDERARAVFSSRTEGIAWQELGMAPFTSGACLSLPDGSALSLGGLLPANESQLLSTTNAVFKSRDRGRTWQSLIPEWSARRHPATALLASGAILLCGGASSANAIEPYFGDCWRSLSGGTSWELTSSNSSWGQRAGHAIVSVANGGALIIGGESENYDRLDGVFLSEDEGKTWSMVTPSSDTSFPRRAFFGVLRLSDTDFTVCGGIAQGGSPENDVWRLRYFLGVLTWHKVAAVAAWSPRYAHAIARASEQSWVLLGGCSDQLCRVHLADVWLSRDDGLTWTPAYGAAALSTVQYSTPISVRHMRGTSSVYVIRRGPPFEALVLRPGDASISGALQITVAADASATAARFHGAAETVVEHSHMDGDDQSVVFLGGEDPDAGRLTSTRVIIIVLRTLSLKQLVPTAAPGWAARRDATAQTVLASGLEHIVLFGGMDDTGTVLADAWISNTVGRSWRELTKAAPWGARYRPAAWVIGSDLFVTGGAQPFQASDPTIWSLNIPLRAFSNDSSPSTPRFGANTLTFPDGAPCVVGGRVRFSTSLFATQTAECLNRDTFATRLRWWARPEPLLPRGTDFLALAWATPNVVLVAGGPLVALSRTQRSDLWFARPKQGDFVSTRTNVDIEWRGCRLVSAAHVECAASPNARVHTILLRSSSSASASPLQWQPHQTHLGMCKDDELQVVASCDGSENRARSGVFKIVNVVTLRHEPLLIGNARTTRIWVTAQVPVHLRMVLYALRTGGRDPLLELVLSQQHTASTNHSLDVSIPEATPAGPAQLCAAGPTLDALPWHLRCVRVHPSCPSGQAPARSTGLCTPCGRGTYRNDSLLTELCTECPAGSFAPFPGASQCLPCPTGFFNELPGQSACRACPAGTYATMPGSTSAQGCSACPAGTYAATQGSSMCTRCEQGTFSPVVGAFDSATCARCPLAHQTTLRPGAADLSACVCAAAFLWDHREGQCTTCLHGMNCSSAALTIRSVSMLPGYWRATALSAFTYKCSPMGVCIGGRLSDNATARGAELCKPGHWGPRCELCSRGSYQGPSGDCVSCSGRTPPAFFIVGTCACFLVLGIVFHIWRASRPRNRQRNQNIEATISSSLASIVRRTPAAGVTNAAMAAAAQKPRKRSFRFLAKLKFVTGFVQVAVTSGITQDVPWPASIGRLMGVLSLLSLDASDAVPWSCVIPSWTFLHSVVLVSATPFLLLGVVVIAAIIIRRTVRTHVDERRASLREAAWTVALVILFLSYPLVSARLFLTLSCEQFEGDAWRLRADSTVDCTDDVYSLFRVFTILMICVYVLGVPALFAGLLYRHYDAVRQQSATSLLEALVYRDGCRQIQHLRFLYDAYRPPWFLTEVLELVRKMLLTSGLVLMSPASRLGAYSLQAATLTGARGSAMQSVVAIVLVVSFMLAYALGAPLIESRDNMALIIVLFELFLVFNIGLTLKVDTMRQEVERALGLNAIPLMFYVMLCSAASVFFVKEKHLKVYACLRSGCMFISRCFCNLRADYGRPRWTHDGQQGVIEMTVNPFANVSQETPASGGGHRWSTHITGCDIEGTGLDNPRGQTVFAQATPSIAATPACQQQQQGCDTESAPSIKLILKTQ